MNELEKRKSRGTNEGCTAAQGEHTVNIFEGRLVVRGGHDFYIKEPEEHASIHRHNDLDVLHKHTCNEREGAVDEFHFYALQSSGHFRTVTLQFTKAHLLTCADERAHTGNDTYMSRRRISTGWSGPNIRPAHSKAWQYNP